MKKLLLAVTLLVGCARSGDPESTRLSPGSEAMAYGVTTLEMDSQSDDAEHPNSPVQPGILVRVIGDVDRPDDGSRKVIVRVLEGRRSGSTGRIRRKDLREVPR